MGKSTFFLFMPLRLHVCSRLYMVVLVARNPGKRMGLGIKQIPPERGCDVRAEIETVDSTFTGCFARSTLLAGSIIGKVWIWMIIIPGRIPKREVRIHHMVLLEI